MKIQTSEARSRKPEEKPDRADLQSADLEMVDFMVELYRV